MRRQLAAVAPLTADVLTVGARRERPNLIGLSGPALLAQAQADLSVAGEVITPTSEPERWLGGTDPCVLELFAKAR